MVHKNFSLGILFTFILIGCAQEPTQPPRPSYAEQLESIPVPHTQKDRDRECAHLRSEIARMKNIAMAGTATLAPMYALNIQIQARNNIAALESKAAQFRCAASFGVQQQPQSNIESCVETCKANTSRTPEQCFDACNHK